MSQTLTGSRGTVPRRPTRATARLLAVAGLVLVLVLTFAAGTILRERVDRTDHRTARSAPPVAVTTDARIASLQTRLTAKPDDTRAALDLAAAYLQKVRETADSSWYAKSEALVTDVLRREPDNAEAMSWLGALDLSKHQFRSGLDWGLKAHAADPNLLAAYPVLIDAYVELGRYEEAVATSDEFIQLRPDLPSYTRVSYLRELHGDRDGAIDAMLLALDTVPANTESGAWTRVQLGMLYFNGGDLDAAEREFQHTLAVMPGYAPAEAGLARVAASRGDFTTAISLLNGVTARLPLPEYVILLGDVYTAAGDPANAAQQYALVRIETQLLSVSGVNTDLELALFDADHPPAGSDPAQIVAEARTALAARPSIYGHDTLAWALYRAGDYAGAQTEVAQALRLGTQDALLEFHAGMIAAALGDDDSARRHLSTALQINPYFSLLHALEARDELARLAGRS